MRAPMERQDIEALEDARLAAAADNDLALDAELRITHLEDWLRTEGYDIATLRHLDVNDLILSLRELRVRRDASRDRSERKALTLHMLWCLRSLQTRGFRTGDTE